MQSPSRPQGKRRGRQPQTAKHAPPKQPGEVQPVHAAPHRQDVWRLSLLGGVGQR